MRAKHVADVIARNSRDQTQLLEDFVDDGRTILGALELQRVALNMDELLTDAITRLNPLLTLHGVSLDTNFDTLDVSVTGDLRRLTRLAYRLLAIVARRAREATKIEIETDVDRGHYVLALSGTALRAGLVRTRRCWICVSARLSQPCTRGSCRWALTLRDRASCSDCRVADAVRRISILWSGYFNA